MPNKETKAKDTDTPAQAQAQAGDTHRGEKLERKEVAVALSEMTKGGKRILARGGSVSYFDRELATQVTHRSGDVVEVPVEVIEEFNGRSPRDVFVPPGIQEIGAEVASSPRG